MPVAGGDSRADGAGRVHGAAGEVAGREDAEDDSEADRDGRNVAVGGAGRRHGVGEDGDHESEGGDDLDEDRLGDRDATDVVAAEVGGVERVRGESCRGCIKFQRLHDKDIIRIRIRVRQVSGIA